MDRKVTAFTIVIAMLVLVNAYFFIQARREDTAGPGSIFNTAQAYILPPNQVSYLPVRDTAFSDVKLDAKAAAIYDVDADRMLYEKNIRERLPVASLTKILTAIVVWEKFSPNDVVTIRDTAIKIDGERQDVYAGETLSVNSLTQMMLVESSNDAAYALRDHATEKGFDLVAEMNIKALSLGMNDTRFLDPAGLNDEGYSTVTDLVKAVRYALRYDSIWNFSREATATVTSTDGKFTHELKSTNQLLNVLADIIGGKTGYTESALGCMILLIEAPDKSDRLIAVVLGSHGRFEDMQRLVAWTKDAYSW